MPTPEAAIKLCWIRNRNSLWMNNPEESSRSRCSATDPARVFSIGITAAATALDRTFPNTSADDTQGTTVARRSIRCAASWLKEPSSPWIATLIAEQCSRPAATLPASATRDGLPKAAGTPLALLPIERPLANFYNLPAQSRTQLV